METSQQETQPQTLEDSAERLSAILSNIKSFMPEWKSLTLPEVSFSRLTGFTNITYKVAVLDPDTPINPRILVYREFCSHESFFSRDEEGLIFRSLAEMGVGPKDYGGNNVFRLEEFIAGKHPDSQISNSRDFNLASMKYIATFHQQHIQGIQTSAKSLEWINKGRPFPDFYATTEKYLEILKGDDLAKLEEIRGFVNDKELEFLRKEIEEIKPIVVFSHNDLNAQNIFLRETGLDLKNSIILIDFEYCGYNFRGYDIGNFLIEHCFDYSYAKPPSYFLFTFSNFPADEFLEEMASFYCFFNFFVERKEEWGLEVLALKKADLGEILIKKGIIEQMEVFDRQVSHLVSEIRLGTLLSLFYWILWSGGICQDPNIKFDYLEHGKLKVEAYLALKSRWFPS